MEDKFYKVYLNNGAMVVFNLNRKIIGRAPTGTNLKESGSDNNMYIASAYYESLILDKVLCYFSSKSIENQPYITFDCKGKKIGVKININEPNNQVQLRLTEMKRIKRNGQYYTGKPLNEITKSFFGILNEKDLYQKAKNSICCFDYQNRKIEYISSSYFKTATLLENYDQLLKYLPEDDIRELNKY